MSKRHRPIREIRLVFLAAPEIRATRYTCIPLGWSEEDQDVNESNNVLLNCGWGVGQEARLSVLCT
ncbi:hypothetical protein E5D57_004878 [Metarhizium anisopliae]|nr:hypothetical protein E5D57_004878 [Metarhizium anisopliae]